MISTGIVRKVDSLGRFVLPSELREKLHIKVGDAIEIFTNGDLIILKKYQASDIFTGETDNLIDYKDKKVSVNSIKELARLAGLTLVEDEEKKNSSPFDIESII